MNREQKRAYAKKIKNDKRASTCPLCGTKALFYSSFTETSPYNTESAGGTGIPKNMEACIKCEVCNKVVLKDPAIETLLPPNHYVPMPLPLFELALNEEIKKRIDEENKAEEKASNELEMAELKEEAEIE